MSHTARKFTHISAADYLAQENDGDWRHAFVDGADYPMPEMTADHNLIRGGVLLQLMDVRETLDVFAGDFKLRIKTADRDRFYFPDVFVTHRTLRADPYYATDAILTIEVLSPETERLDRGEKFEAYRLLPSMTEYVLLSTEAEEMEIFRRGTGWRRELYSRTSVVQLESVDMATNVSTFYRQSRKRG